MPNVKMHYVDACDDIISLVRVRESQIESVKLKCIVRETLLKKGGILSLPLVSCILRYFGIGFEKREREWADCVLIIDYYIY
jgi:hypothetical protein